MSVCKLLGKVPAPVLTAILKKLDLRFADICNVTFEFGPGIAPGSTRREDGHTFISIDETQLHGYLKEYPWFQNAFYNVLVHELQHFKQNLQGIFIQARGVLYWNGAPIIHVQSTIPGQGITFEQYRNLPWERDANDTSRRVVDELVREGWVKPTPDPDTQWGKTPAPASGWFHRLLAEYGVLGGF